MIKRLKIVSFLAVGFWLSHPVIAAESEQVDTLIDINGREIRAVVEKVFNTSVVFRRVSDNEIFDLPLDRLNEATRQRLQEIKRGEGREMVQGVEPVGTAAASAEWKRLRVVLPNPLDAVAISGLGNLGQEQRAASTYELRIPEGCWVKVNLKANQEMLEHLVRFDGKASRWTFRSEGPHLYLSEDDGPEKVVGVTLEEGTGPEKWFAAGSVPFAESLSVELQEAAQIERLGTPPARISAICASNYELSDVEIASIAKRNPTALAIDLDYSLMPSLSHFEGAPIEACSLEFLNEPVEIEGGRAKSYPVELPSLPRLKYFNNFFTENPEETASSPALPNWGTRNLSLRMQVDGISHLYLMSGKIWFDHSRGRDKAPGRHLGEFPTYLNNKTEWLPVWNGDQTLPRATRILIPEDEPVNVHLRQIDGRGNAQVIQQPTSENDHTVIVELRDEGEGGRSFASSDWLEFRLSW